MQKLESVLKNETHKIPRDIEIKTDHSLAALVLILKKNELAIL